MIKLGILDFDTSHCAEFTRRLNQIGKDQEGFFRFYESEILPEFGQKGLAA